MDAKQVSDLKTFSRQQHCTLFMTLFAAFTTLLHRLTSQNDFVVATAVSGRAEAERTGLLGYCSHLLPIRHQLDPQSPFTEHLAQTRRRLLDGYEHEAYPFAWLLEALHEQPGGHNTALTSIIFNLDQPMILPSLGAAACQPYAVPQPALGFDLMVNVMEINQELILDCDYSTALLDDTTVERWLGHWQILLTTITNQPQMPISTLPLLTTAEYQQIVHEWNDTTVDFGPPQTIHALFEQQVERTPDAIAVISPKSEVRGQERKTTTPDGSTDFAEVSALLTSDALTYAELNARANQLAHYLRQAGVRTETPVGICLNRSFNFIIATLAIMKAGGTYVPLDAAYPRDRLQFMICDTGLELILTQTDLIEHLPNNVRSVDMNTLDLHPYPETALAPYTTTDNLLYIMYTSGSTGQPKGIEILHRNVQRLVKGANFTQLDAKQTFLQLSSPSFDAATLEIWGSLCNGAQLVIYSDRVIDLYRVGQLIQRHRVTILWLTSGLFNQMVDNNPEGLKGIKQLLIGGEALSVQHVERFLASSDPKLMLINGYGPTENTTFTTTYRIVNFNTFTNSVPIGVPISNTRVYLLDEWLQPTPIGVAGELYTGGLGIARGYLNRPELTAERFIEHPELGRLYKTGDLCRWLPDGNIEYIGRTDFQVKIRGFRIELGEIESVLLSQEGVREAVVVAREETAGDKRLVAYVVPDKGTRWQGDKVNDVYVTDSTNVTLSPPHPVTLSALCRALQAKLPEYMMPSAFVLLEALPLTPNGKLDRRALPAPDYADAQHEFVAPRNELETQLAAIWQAVLGSKRVATEQSRGIGVYDNFFALGGHSLLATQVISRIRQAFVIDLPLRIFFEMPTIAGLATRIRMGEVVQRLAQTNTKQNKADTTKVEEEW